MKMLLRCLLSLCVFVVTPAQGEWLYGLGFANNLVGPQVEWASRHYSVYVLPGFFTKSGGLDVKDVRWVVGGRYRLEGGTTVTDGFYVGALAGDLGKDKGVKRYGAGLELGHQWVTTNLRWTLGAGVAVLESKKCEDYRSSTACQSETTCKGEEKDVEPALTLSATLMLRR